MKILIYEDGNFKDIYPLSMLRPVYDIRCGALTIRERIESIVGNKHEILLHCRKVLERYLIEVHKNKINLFPDDDLFLLNGRMIHSNQSLKTIFSAKEKNAYFVYKNETVGAFVSKENIASLKNKVQYSEDGIFSGEFFKEFDLKKIKLKDDEEIFSVRYSWDIINYIIHGGLDDDMKYFLDSDKTFDRPVKNDNYINRKEIFISKSTKIFPNVVIDASEGSVVISANSTIEPFTFIKGPVYIGRNAFVKSGSKIYGPCVIGEYSKVAGEIAESVFHSYVNKQHEGFVGHSYVCPFVNLGADTVTSDLKNNYSKIRVKLNNKDFETGMQFLGAIIGDHSKTSINTMLNTGSMVGIFANIFGGGFPSKEINSFSWNEGGKTPTKYDSNKAIETARIAMSRRGIKMSRAYEDLVRYLF